MERGRQMAVELVLCSSNLNFLYRKFLAKFSSDAMGKKAERNEYIL